MPLVNLIFIAGVLIVIAGLVTVLRVPFAWAMGLMIAAAVALITSAVIMAS